MSLATTSTLVTASAGGGSRGIATAAPPRMSGQPAPIAPHATRAITATAPSFLSSSFAASHYDPDQPAAALRAAPSAAAALAAAVSPVVDSVLQLVAALAPVGLSPVQTRLADAGTDARVHAVGQLSRGAWAGSDAEPAAPSHVKLPPSIAPASPASSVDTATLRPPPTLGSQALADALADLDLLSHRLADAHRLSPSRRPHATLRHRSPAARPSSIPVSPPAGSSVAADGGRAHDTSAVASVIALNTMANTVSRLHHTDAGAPTAGRLGASLTAADSAMLAAADAVLPSSATRSPSSPARTPPRSTHSSPISGGADAGEGVSHGRLTSLMSSLLSPTMAQLRGGDAFPAAPPADPPRQAALAQITNTLDGFSRQLMRRWLQGPSVGLRAGGDGVSSGPGEWTSVVGAGAGAGAGAVVGAGSGVYV